MHIALQVRLIVGNQLTFTRFCDRGEVLLQELHFLDNSAPDNLVVAVQTPGDPFAIEHFLVDVTVNQPAQRAGRCRIAVLSAVAVRQLRYPVRRNGDSVAVSLHLMVLNHTEEACAYHKEMNQWFASEAAEYQPRTA